jgi:hypothetical protein
MPCEKYQGALTDLAAGGGELTGEVRSHLHECVPCRAYVEEERSLLAAIDSGVRRSTNATLPPALLHRFEARFAQQAPPNRALNLRWLYAGAAIATAAVFIVFALPHLRSRVTMEQATDELQTAHAVIEQPQEIRPWAPPIPRVAPPATHQLGKHLPTPRTNTQPEVLVPPDERVAFEHFLSDLNEREDLAAAIVKPIHARPEQRVTSLDTPDIETAALTVEPIQDGSDR